MKDNKGLAEVYDSQDFREWGRQLVDMLADQLDIVQSGDYKVVYPHQSPESELEFWADDFSEKSDPMATFQNLIHHSTQLQHPKYIGHQTAVVAPVSVLAGMVSQFFNNTTGTFEMGPASNAMERVVTDFTGSKIGYDSKASGLLTSGGSLANLTALLAARREKAVGDVWEEGAGVKLAVMVSEEAHYCIDRAVRILGLGAKGIIKVPVDKDFKIRAEKLEQYWEAARAEGYHVFCVIGCAGSTSTGSYDNLNALADFSENHNIWFHVDGAHGGAVVFSNKYSYLVDGIERADSIAIDFHKMLMSPALNTALMFKEGRKIYQTFAHEAKYLWDSPESEEWYNSAKRAFECSKPSLSAMVYIILKTYGHDIFEKNVNHLYDSAKVLADLVSERPRFELAMSPESNIVNFRYLGNSDNEINLDLLNAEIRNRIVESGKFYLVQTIINGQRTLRCSIMNPLTSIKDFGDLLDEIEQVGLEFQG